MSRAKLYYYQPFPFTSSLLVKKEDDTNDNDSSDNGDTDESDNVDNDGLGDNDDSRNNGDNDDSPLAALSCQLEWIHSTVHTTTERYHSTAFVLVL